MVWKLFKSTSKSFLFQEDIRNLDQDDFDQVDTVIHLANVANDPAVELNPTLSWEVNVLALSRFVITQCDLMSSMSFMRPPEAYTD